MAAESAVAIENQVAIFHRAVVIDNFHEEIAFGAKRFFQDALLNLNGDAGPQHVRFGGEFFFAHLPENTGSNRQRQLSSDLI